MITIRRNRIKVNGRYYNVSVSTYDNKRLQLALENDSKYEEVTTNIPSLFLEEGKVFLNPNIKSNGILKALKKKRIIREICTTASYDGKDIPVAILNMGILRSYDFNGVTNHLRKVENL